MQSVEIHNTFNVLTLSARMTVAHFLSIYVAIAILCSRVVAYCVNESSVVWINERQPSIIGTFVNCLIYTQDAMIAPYYTTAKIINVSTEIFLNNLIKVDEVTSTVTLDFFFVTYWYDDRLLMPALWEALPNPQVYKYGVDVSEADGLTNVQGVQPSMWLPDIVFPDAVEITQTEEYLKMYPTGQLRRMQHFIMTLSQGHMEYANYPCDTQNISMTYFSFTLASDQLVFQPIITEDGAHLPNPPVDVFYPLGSSVPAFAENPVWSLEGTGYDYVNWQLSDGFLLRSFGVATFRISRRSRGIIMRLCMPVLLIMLLCALSYWGTVNDRIATTVTGLLAIAALYIAVMGSIPLVGYMTRLDKFMFTMFMVIFINTMVHMAVVRLNTKEKGTNWPLRKLAVRVLEFFGRVAMIPWIILTYLICFLPTVQTYLVVLVSVMLALFEYVMLARYLPELQLTYESTKLLVQEKKRNGKGKHSQLSSLEIKFLRYCCRSDDISGTHATGADGVSHDGVEIEMQHTNSDNKEKNHVARTTRTSSRGSRGSGESGTVNPMSP